MILSTAVKRTKLSNAALLEAQAGANHALVGNLNSTLARRADAVIDGSVDQERVP